MKTPAIVGTLTAIAIVVVGLLVLAQSLYVVDVTEQAIVIRFGDINAVRVNPGLYAKGPFADSVVRFDNRVLRVDWPPGRMLDNDNNILEIDAYARFQITDPAQFLKTLFHEETARRVLSQRINAALRAEVAERNPQQIIGGQEVLGADGNPVLFATDSRTIMLNKVLSSVQQGLAAESPSFGIEMIDVKIKRLNFSEPVVPSVFNRMRENRNRISSRIRADGEAQAAKTQAEAEARRTVILAEAQVQVNAVTAEKNAKAIDTLIRVLGADSDLFRYQDSLEAYKVARGLTRR